MTNEVANAAAGAAANGACGLNDALNAQLTQGQELWNQILTWLVRICLKRMLYIYYRSDSSVIRLLVIAESGRIGGQIEDLREKLGVHYKIVAAVVFDEDMLIAFYAISGECDEQYNNAKWEYEAESAYILHRFCVSPKELSQIKLYFLLK